MKEEYVKKSILCKDIHSHTGWELSIQENGKVFFQEKEPAHHIADSNYFLGKGLFDLQINGFAGVDFNTYPIREPDFLHVIQELLRTGVSSFFPTIITNSVEAICALLSNLDELCRNNSQIADFVPGIHLEGPFISPQEGARGAHPEAYVRAPDWEWFERFQKASGGRICLLTLSPEWPNSAAFIERCVASGVKVAIGHTLASSEQIEHAIKAGASLSTHLGNGAPLMLPRNDNMIIQQLADQRLSASIIADGFHLPNSFLQLAMAAKGEKLLLVSDSTMFAGMPPGNYDSHIGGKVVLTEEGKLHMVSSTNMLAGSAVSLLHCVQHLYQQELCSLEQAWAMASTYPATFMRETLETEAEYSKSDHVIFTEVDNMISVKAVIKAGKLVFAQALL